MLTQITPSFFIAGQLSKQDIDFIKSQGIETIVCHRPDSEDTTQDSSNSIKECCAPHGIEMHYIPFSSPADVSQSDIDALAQALDVAKGPVLGYCRSGKRALVVWILVQRQKKSAEEVRDMLKASDVYSPDLEAFIA